MPEQYLKKSVSFSRDGLRIAGGFYTPATYSAPFPTVILSHGFGDSMNGTRASAQWLAENGIAVCIFDFIGGSMHGESDGDMQHMSVLTEAADLEQVLHDVRSMPEVDGENIFLMGESQGGFVSTYVAAKHPEVKALIACYPAYVLQDDARKRVASPDYKPGFSRIMGIHVGEIYDTDALSFDIYDLIRTYDKPVLLLHGTADEIVPIAYSERAKNTFQNAQLVKIPGAGHGFVGAQREQALNEVTAFIHQNM